MKMNSFEYHLTLLDRQVLATRVANRNLAMQRLRHLDTTNKPRPTPGATFFEDDDLLLDNVPI
tara:strand:+ start:360 stop:548 length:189 start_codon:yes stop_codon:yes gene_type:complete